MITTISEASRALREGKTTSVALTDDALMAADALNPQLDIFVTLFADEARAAARRADEERERGVDRGPLHGIPIAVKDNIATREAATTAQSRVTPPGFASPFDAEAVRLLREAGAIILGKTTLMEYGIGLPNPNGDTQAPRNPWNVERWAGGSSSGTASGTAAGVFFGGLGTDTGGSIRIPAAYCGITGFKPTLGLIPVEGAVPLGFSLDTIGPLARTAEDCRLLVEPLLPHDVEHARPQAMPQDERPLAGITFGIDRRSSADDPQLSALIDDALATFEELGAAIVEVTVPLYDELTTVTMTTELAEAFAYHRARLRDAWDEYDASTRMIIASGALTSAADYVQAQRVRAHGTDAVNTMFRDVHAIIMPTVTQGAPTLPLASLDEIVETAFTPYWNATGHPVVSFPIGFDDGLPMSLQLVGPLGSDITLLSFVERFQSVTTWHAQLPPLHAQSVLARKEIPRDSGA